MLRLVLALLFALSFLSSKPALAAPPQASPFASPPMQSAPSAPSASPSAPRTQALPWGAAASKPTATTKQSSPKADPFAVGHLYCRGSEWEKALSFFEKQRRERFLQLSTVDRVRLFTYLGVVYANLLQKEQSESAFEKALLLDPCAILPTLNSIAPQIRERFRAMRIEYLRACQMQQREEAERIERQKRLASAKKPRPKALVLPKMTPSKALGISMWVTTGVGSAALVAALTFGGLAWWDQIRQQEQPFTLKGTHDYLSYHRQAQDRAWMANLLFGVAGALLFTGFALHLSRSLIAFPAAPPPAKKPSTTQQHTRPLSSLSSSSQDKPSPPTQGRTHEFSLH